MPQAQIDTISLSKQGMQGVGTVAQRLIANRMDPNALRPFIGPDGRAYMTVNEGGKLKNIVVNTVATLRYDEWKQYDTAIVREARIRLQGVQDLVSRGLVYSIANGLGKTILQSENLNEFMEAQLSMDGLSRGTSDRGVYGMDYLPLPLIHADYYINARALAESRNTGEAMDVTNAEMAARAVSEKMEDMLFNGASSYKYGLGTIYGYLDFPNVNTYSLPAHWDHSGVTGEQIVEDCRKMKAALIADRFYGPFQLYIPTAYETILDKDYSVSGGNNPNTTIRARILQIAGISGITVIDKMAADKIVMVQMTSDVVRMVSGMEIAPVEWQEQGGMVTHYKVMGIKVPQIRSTQAGRCGVLVAS